jgi:hypothetical protein
MSRKKTFGRVGLVAFLIATGTAAQSDPQRTPLAQVFAECVGRYSAEREHAWLIGGSDARAMETQRMAFTSLLEATQSPQDSRAMLSYRIEVKMAHASLLTRATFGTDAESARHAERLARMHIASCQDLLLGG